MVAKQRVVWYTDQEAGVSAAEGGAVNHIVIDRERCKGCELCTSACRYNLIVLSGHFNSKGYHPAEVAGEGKHECTSCALCARMCPDAAIDVYRRSAAA